MDERLLDVNEHGVLRVPGTIWLSLMVLSRHWWLFFFSLLSGGGGGDLLGFLDRGLPWWPMALQLPVIGLLLAGPRRTPSAGQVPRVIWRHARVLVLLTTLLNLGWTVWSLSRSDTWRPRPELVLVCFSCLDLVIAWSFWFSRYFRQVFIEFPQPAAE